METTQKQTENQMSTNWQVAIGSLVATLFSLGTGVAVGLAKLHPMPGPIVIINGAIITVGLFALPLVWWRNKIGYVCAILVGLVNVIGDLIGFAQGMPFSPGMPEGTPVFIVLQIIFSALLVVYTIRMWREKI
jgi:hypothetical protein